MNLSKQKKRGHVKYGVPETTENSENPFVNEDLEDSETSYHSYRLSNGGKLSFYRDRRDFVGFIRIRISDCDLELPEKLTTPWTGWGDASRAAFQWLEGLGIEYRIIDKVERLAGELRHYQTGPRFDTR